MGISPATRLLAVLVAAALGALLTAAATNASTAAHLDVPHRAEIARTGAPIELAAVPSSRVLRPGTYWGGDYAASTGEKTTSSRTYSVATPLDGVVNATLRVPAGGRFTLSLAGADGAAVARGSGSRTVSLSTLVCGRRTLQVRVTRVSGTGAFRLALDRP